MFCLPITSAKAPSRMRLTVFTPLFSANKIAANALEYPSVVENVVRKVSGTKFPDACNRAASDCNINVGLRARETLTRVRPCGRPKRHEALKEMGRVTARVRRPSSRRVQRRPTVSRRRRVIGDRTRPPQPAPVRGGLV
jgi:hypothetical protein